ncbi:hypothetical protein Tco_1073192 [Tanacetum coccineum]|uniref:Uncharacterized protein n=1 Tax=Tanacetum coccineum TaxID=301880 RepID=A0ABQ5IPP6_9ASTR
MALESTSSQKSSHLSPSSKVNFKCEEGIIAFNNAVALLEHPNVLYHPMLTFLLNSCISTVITRQPFATYVEYLREFWYSAEPESSLIFSSEKVNADDTADKSLSRTSMQPITQPKAPTDLKLKKKKIPLLPIQNDKEGVFSDSGLQSKPDYDLASLTGFETPDSADNDSQEESNITKQVIDAIQSFVPSLAADTLKYNLPSLLLKALKNSLPQMVHDSIKHSVSQSIEEKLPLFDDQVQQTLKVKDLRIMYNDMVSLLKAVKVFKKANAEGEKWEKNNTESLTEEKDAQNPDQTKGDQHSRDTIIAIAQGEQPPA